MKTIKECTNEMIKQFKMLQWECTIEGDAIAIVKECFSRLASDQRLPDYIEPLVWEHFKEHRIMIKKKMTPHAEELMILALSRAKSDGVDPNELLNAVMLNGWQGIGNKANQYNGIIKNAQPTENNRQYLNTSHQMDLARKEFENERGTQHTSTSKNVSSSTLRSIQYSNANK
tara:strand:- start:92 stop:610 length:519 start_codon:yes stop_codon:yes gene_type:complete